MKTFLTFIGENEDDYRGEHQAPGPTDGAPLHDVTANGIYPKDYYTHSHYYNLGERYDNESHGIISSKQNRPNHLIKIHRAIPKDTPKGTKINKGDWVTINRKYALDHGRSNLGGKGNFRVISKTVRANEVFTDGNSIHEWGYHPMPRDAAADKARMERIAAKKAAFEALPDHEKAAIKAKKEADASARRESILQDIRNRREQASSFSLNPHWRRK